MGNGIDRTITADWLYPKLVAHRCGGTLAPENTLAGFDACVRYGYRMVEFDAKLSADNELFLLHDDTLERTTNGHGAAAEHTWDQLAALDAGAWFGPHSPARVCRRSLRPPSVAREITLPPTLKSNRARVVTRSPGAWSRVAR